MSNISKLADLASGLGSGTPSLENLNFGGTGRRITGDFSNATVANRVMFQSSTTNSQTSVASLPNGTSTSASILAFNASDPANAAYAGLLSTATDARLVAGIIGTGTYLPLVMHTGGLERLRIDTSGNVGIGTSSPVELLQVYKDSANATVAITNSTTGAASTDGFRLTCEIGTGDAYLIQRENANMIFRTNNTERMRIDSSGNVGIGLNNPIYKLHVNGNASLQGTTIDSAAIQINAGGSGNRYAYIDFIGDDTYTDYGLRLIRDVAGANATSSLIHRGTSALEFATVDAAPMRFLTTNAERMRIDPSGNLRIGTSGGSGRLGVKTSDTSSGTWGCYMTNSADTIMFAFLNNGAFYTGSGTGSPFNATTGAAANLVVTSDAGSLMRSTSSLRYKENVVTSTHGLNELLKLRSVLFNNKNDDKKIVYGGLIAEETDAAGLSEFVLYDSEGRPDAIHYGNMVGLCIKAIQEQQELISALTTRIEQLEGN